MTEAMVSPSIISWARERQNIAVAQVADKLNVKVETVMAWESGDVRPTFRQARKLADAFHVPFGYLYLQAPPPEELPIADFRATHSHPRSRPSPDLLDLLTDTLGKQQWLRDYRESQGSAPLPFVGRFSPTDSERLIADDIRSTIAVEDARSVSATWDDFMRGLARNAEKAGILVLRSGVVGNNNHRPLDVAEFRGFSISDSLAPLVFVNARDFRSAQIFTLAHELAHIWLGQGGLSNPDYELALRDSDVERSCNRIAGETLVPEETLQPRWSTSSAPILERVRQLAKGYKVSAMAVLIKARDHQLVSSVEYSEAFASLRKDASNSQLPTEPGGNFHNTLLARNGSALTEAVILSADHGSLMLSEAADLLGVKVKTLGGIAERLFGSPLSLA